MTEVIDSQIHNFFARTLGMESKVYSTLGELGRFCEQMELIARNGLLSWRLLTSDFHLDYAASSDQDLGMAQRKETPEPPPPPPERGQ